MAKFDPVSENPGSTTSSDSDNLSLHLQGLLAEYNTLRSEIQYRSGFQNRFIEIQVTALTVILGASITESLGPWALLLIPIESAIFGLWYMDHALVIGDIGAYIGKIEERISTMLNVPNLLTWESGSRSTVDTRQRRREVFFNLQLLTFGAPASVCLIITLILLVLSFLQVAFQVATGLQLPMNPTGLELLLAAVGWFAGLWLTVKFIARAKYQSTVFESKKVSVK